MDWKTGEAMHLLIQFHNFVGQPSDLVTKAQVFDETVAKFLPLTGAKVLHIVVDYAIKMETLLVEMRKLMTKLKPATLLQQAPFDLSEFPEILVAKNFQGLLTPTKTTKTNLGTFGLTIEPSLDARTK